MKPPKWTTPVLAGSPRIEGGWDGGPEWGQREVAFTEDRLDPGSVEPTPVGAPWRLWRSEIEKPIIPEGIPRCRFFGFRCFEGAGTSRFRATIVSGRIGRYVAEAELQQDTIEDLDMELTFRLRDALESGITLETTWGYLDAIHWGWSSRLGRWVGSTREREAFVSACIRYVQSLEDEDERSRKIVAFNAPTVRSIKLEEE